MTNTIISIQTVIFQAALLGGSFLPTKEISKYNELSFRLITATFWRNNETDPPCYWYGTGWMPQTCWISQIYKPCSKLEKESTMDGPLSFLLFFFLIVPFALMNIMAYRRERKKADEELQALLRENNKLLKESFEKTNPSWCFEHFEKMKRVKSTFTRFFIWYNSPERADNSKTWTDLGLAECAKDPRVSCSQMPGSLSLKHWITWYKSIPSQRRFG